MTMEILPVFIRQFNQNARKYVPHDEPVVLTVHGHRSCIGQEWLHLCQQFRIEVIPAPVYNAYFLQLCDSHTKKSFKRNMRRLKDFFCSVAIMNTRTVNFKIAAGVEGYRGITPGIALKSFQDVGLHPMD